MLTPQEVSSHAFPKAVMGGYNMTAVDEFLDELTDDYTALYKENAALKAKMKVLVEKVEDYRATEDSMRATLLTAQKMADSIVKEAEAKRDRLMGQAEADAREKIAQMQAEVTETQERLRAGRQELAAFIASVREVCAKELEYLEQLPQLPVEAAEATPTPEEKSQQEQATVGEIEQSIYASFNTSVEELEEPREPAAEAEAPDPADYPQGNPFEEDPVDEPTRRIDLKDLKFGRNYSGERD